MVAEDNPAPTQLQLGKKLYDQKCASCHGSAGQGVAGKYDETLFGDKSLSDLTKIIVETMPDEKPEEIVGDDARAVAEYMYETFYTAVARAKNRPPRVDMLRLTNTQYANITTDLLASFLGIASVNDERGLAADYYNSRSFRRNERKIDRVDPIVSFDFKEASPGEEIKPEEFSIQWQGSLIAPETGDYEFCIKTQNGFRLWVNDQSTALIDGWVASGNEVSEHRQKIRLLGGRVYPLRLDYFKFKDPAASIELRWRPPGGVDEVIPTRHLSPKRVPESFIVNTQFPPDDASLGYERGSSVSKAWAQAATAGSIEVANYVVRHVNRLANTKDDDQSRNEKIKSFCHRFVERAFRRPLSEELKGLFIEQQFSTTPDPEEAIKRVVILSLNSPQFLYVELKDNQVDAFDIASRLSFGLWDSLPDQDLWKAAMSGDLLKPEVVRAQAHRMLKDDRTRYKVKGFFHVLLPFHEGNDLSKDAEAYPMFTKEFVADLKMSLELFIENVIWSDQSDYRDLLLSSDLYLNSRLAPFYDAELTGSSEFQKVSLNPEQRAGVVTHPFLLSALAYHQSSSPIHRGVFVTRKILNRSLKPPPMAIEFKDSRFDPTLTMREKVEELTKSTACQTCHSTINPLGFSFENYDAIGRFRTMEKEKPINVKSEYLTQEGEKIEFAGARDVAEFAIANETAQQGFIEHLFNHTIKQAPIAYGNDTLKSLRDRFIADEFNIQKLLIEINTLAAMHGVSPATGEQ